MGSASRWFSTGSVLAARQADARDADGGAVLEPAASGVTSHEAASPLPLHSSFAADAESRMVFPSGSSTIAKRSSGVTSYGAQCYVVAEADQLLVLGVERFPRLQIELEDDAVAARGVSRRGIPLRVRALGAQEERHLSHLHLDVLLGLAPVRNLEAEPAVELDRALHVGDDHADHVELERHRAQSACGFRRMAKRCARSGAGVVEVLQEFVGGELDLLVVPLCGPVLARDQTHPVNAPEVAVDEAVAGFRLVGRALA